MTYTTIQGDTWDGIAVKLFGSENFMPAMIEANQAYAETVIFGAGVVLTVPEVDTSPAVSSLPPWKTGGAS